jgi:hypothetical protein
MYPQLRAGLVGLLAATALGLPSRSPGYRETDDHRQHPVNCHTLNDCIERT